MRLPVKRSQKLATQSKISSPYAYDLEAPVKTVDKTEVDAKGETLHYTITQKIPKAYSSEGSKALFKNLALNYDNIAESTNYDELLIRDGTDPEVTTRAMYKNPSVTVKDETGKDVTKNSKVQFATLGEGYGIDMDVSPSSSPLDANSAVAQTIDNPYGHVYTLDFDVTIRDDAKRTEFNNVASTFYSVKKTEAAADKLFKKTLNSNLVTTVLKQPQSKPKAQPLPANPKTADPNAKALRLPFIVLGASFSGFISLAIAIYRLRKH